MRNILLVDDELFVIDGIHVSLAWNELGIDNVYKATNGLRALEIIDSHKIDVIITDMKMPIMNGIDFISKLRERNHPAKVIVLSGFNDFSYAQEAIKYNVTEYLLKPITLPILKKAIEKAVVSLLHESSDKEYLMILEQEFEKYKPVLSDYFLTALLNKEINYQLAELIACPVVNSVYRIILVQVGTSEVSKELNDNLSETKRQVGVQRALELTQKLEMEDTRLFVSRIGLYNFAVLQCDNTTSVNSSLSKIDMLSEHLTENGVESYSIGIGKFVTELSQVDVSYMQAEEALRSHVLLGVGSIVAYSDICPDNSTYPYTPCDTEQIRRCLHSRDQKQLLVLIEELKENLRKRNIQDIDFIRDLAIECIVAANLHLYNENETPQIVYKDYPNLTLTVLKLDTLDSIFDLVLSVYNQTIEHLNHRGELKNQRTIELIREFVKENISNDITLEILSKHIHLTPNYIGALFKNATDMYFSDYVTNERMEYAKTLLRDPLCKIYEVASAVGYKNPTYFSKVFKEHTGINPTEYKR